MRNSLKKKNILLAVLCALSVCTHAEKGDVSMTGKYDFIVTDKGELNTKDLMIEMSFRGQQGDMLINGKNRWHFGLLLKPHRPELVGMRANFSYTGDFVKYLKTGENMIEYTPKRQEGVKEHEQELDLMIGFSGGETLYEASWEAEDLVEGDKKVIRFLIEEEEVKETSEPEVDAADLTGEAHEFGG